jgi:glycosyltransferase involved in cell wall biosynthesis
MKILTYSATTAATIKTNLGLPEYSYYFVLKEFLPVLHELGEVVIIENPEQEVDIIYGQCLAVGEPCVFLAFSPPHKTPIHFLCPTIPVFAWEFDSIPNESWLSDPTQDWGYMLRRQGQAITHSAFTVTTVHEVLGERYPVISIPAPVWDHFEDIRNSAQWDSDAAHSFRVDKGIVLDSRTVVLADYLYADPDKVHEETYGRFSQSSSVDEVKLSEFAVAEDTDKRSFNRPNLWALLRITLRYVHEWYRLVLCDVLPSFLKQFLIRERQPASATVSELSAKQIPPVTTPRTPPPDMIDPLTPANHNVRLEGVVFTTVFNPYDGRKNWQDLLTAFCTALRDKPDATLVFKLTNREYHSAITSMLKWMAQLPKFHCRVLLIQGYLGDEDYKSLVHATSFVINASYGEGQCLPLMEFLSCGKPAIAPRHSAMIDYIDEDVAFVVDSWLDSSAWPHDPRLACRTRRQQISWESLAHAYDDAYRTYKSDPAQYRNMSKRAISRMKLHCSRATAITKLRPFLIKASQLQ